MKICVWHQLRWKYYKQSWFRERYEKKKTKNKNKIKGQFQHVKFEMSLRHLYGGAEWIYESEVRNCIWDENTDLELQAYKWYLKPQD